MPRPCWLRRIGFGHGANFIRSAGMLIHDLDVITLTLDQREALRLVDMNGLYHEHAARKMNISRPTFSIKSC